MASSGGGGKLGLVLVLLVALGAAGGFNYWRNLQTEAQEQGPRPLAGYDDAGLAALADAYRTEVEELELARAGARSDHSGPNGGAFIGENVREFERVQKTSQRLRDLLGAIAEREARLREIEQEQQHRARLASGGVQLHLQRLLTI